MKHFKSFLLAVTVMLACSFAMATGTHTPPPPPTPTPAPPWSADVDSSSSSSSSATAGALAGAVSGSIAAGGSATVGPVTATGGAGGLGGAGGTGGASTATSGPSYSAADLTSSNDSSGGSVMESNSSKMYVFPAPVWTQAPRPFGCIVTNSKAGALGWNLFSYSESLQTPEIVCTTLQMVDAALLHCQFLTAEILNQRAYRTMYPNDPELPGTPGVRNLSLAECEAIRNPRMTLAPTLATPPVPKAEALKPLPLIRSPGQ